MYREWRGSRGSRAETVGNAPAGSWMSFRPTEPQHCTSYHWVSGRWWVSCDRSPGPDMWRCSPESSTLDGGWWTSPGTSAWASCPAIRCRMSTSSGCLPAGVHLKSDSNPENNKKTINTTLNQSVILSATEDKSKLITLADKLRALWSDIVKITRPYRSKRTQIVAEAWASVCEAAAAHRWCVWWTLRTASCCCGWTAATASAGRSSAGLASAKRSLQVPAPILPVCVLSTCAANKRTRCKNSFTHTHTYTHSNLNKWINI